MTIFSRLLCRFHFHKWVAEDNRPLRRQCARCGHRQLWIRIKNQRGWIDV